MKIKKILVSQPRPKLESSPFFDLQKRRKLKIDFIPFIHVKGATVKEIRLQKIDLTKFSAIILTSRYAIDHYFRICEKMRFKVPDSMKYFCQSEVVALYLQNHVVYRKRKIYVGKRSFKDLCPLIDKHKNETFLLPTTDKLKPEVPKLIEQADKLFGEQKFEDALKLFEGLIGMDPGNPKIIAGMLRCLLQLKRFEDANEMFESFDESILKDEDFDEYNNLQDLLFFLLFDFFQTNLL